MISTGHKRIPLWWIFVITTTTGVSALVEQCSGAALTFTARKFTVDPVLITLIGSINIAFNFLVAPYASWKSDRVWTPWGRRKPFLIAGWLLLGFALVAVPHAPTLWVLLAVIFFWQFGTDFGYTGPWSPLFFEIVPVQQRGKAVVVKRLMTVLAVIFFNYLLIVNFDAVHRVAFAGFAVTLTGEQVIYYVAALAVFAAVANIGLTVRETPPTNALPRERFRIGAYVREAFAERQFFVIYLLLFCSVALVAWLGQLAPLLITEEFGYSKAVYGRIETITFLVDLVVCLPLAAFLVDRFDRFRIFQICVLVAAADSLAYWLFIRVGAANHIPSVAQIIGFSVGHRLPTAIGLLALEPYVFDLTPREKMGTMNSGFLMVRGILNVLLMNGMGLWVKYYSRIFAPPGKNSYSSALLYITLVGVAGCVVCIYFARLRKQGRVIEYGKA